MRASELSWLLRHVSIKQQDRAAAWRSHQRVSSHPRFQPDEQPVACSWAWMVHVDARRRGELKAVDLAAAIPRDQDTVGDALDRQRGSSGNSGGGPVQD